MRTDQNPELAKAVQRIAKLNAQSKDIGFEIGEIADAAFEAGHVRDVPNKAVARKVLKRLAKDSVLDEIEREAQRQIEETIDICRAALGLLANLPLGGAALAPYSPVDREPATHTNGTPRKRGRPPGAKNKPKVVGGTDAQAPLDPSPQVPDIPDVPAAA